jgi:glutathione synthase/RimK-type ligase-like ATP-grasp enzyme
MSKIPYIKEHLPITRKYNGVDNLVQMLTKYESVFLKPTSLSRGRGIFHIKKADKGYILSSSTGDKVLIESIETLEESLHSSILKNSRYIIQQEIPFTHSGKKSTSGYTFKKMKLKTGSIQAWKRNLLHLNISDVMNS